MSIGATLQQARDARQLTHEQLMSRTRIPLRILVAMEQDDWANVPGGIYARGYLRAYAREVGLDGDGLAARFDAQQAPPPAPEPVEPAARLARPVLRVRWPALSEDGRRWLAGPAFVGLLVLVYVAGRVSTQDPHPVDGALAAPAVVSGTGSSREPLRPVATSSPVPGIPAAVARTDADHSIGADAPLVLGLQATRACWVTASADSTRVVYRILQPGERVEARGRVLTLRVGDAGALKLSLDGEPAKPLGASGQVVGVRITRDNFRSLLPAGAGD